jgi:hypothetical protein
VGSLNIVGRVNSGRDGRDGSADRDGKSGSFGRLNVDMGAEIGTEDGISIVGSSTFGDSIVLLYYNVGII